MAKVDAKEALAASLRWAGVDEPAAEAVPRALRWTWLLWSAGHDQVPPFLVHDLGHTLWRGRAVRYASGRRPPAERARRLRQEDRLLAPWLRDPRILEAHVALAGLSGEELDRSVAHALLLALAEPAAARGWPSGPVAGLRGLLRWAPADRAELLTGSDGDGALVDQVVEELGGRPLLRDEDVWEIGHLREVPSETARLALRTLHRTIAWIGAPAPDVLSEARRAPGEVPRDSDQADVYPTGGFDAMSTRGSLENMVRSEVGYVGEVVAPPLDLFDVRYLEGELLYYTRDESPLLEPRRQGRLHVALDELDTKVRELPTQTWVLALAVALRLHADRVSAFGPLAVTTSLTLSAADDALASQALGMLGLSWAAEIAHRRASVGVGPAPERAVVLSARPRPRGSTATWWVQVGDRVWRLQGPDGGLAVDAADPAALRRLVDLLLV